jgi:hypothetical protein
MLIENRKYHFVGELTLNKSRVLAEQILPRDDKVNWLFLKIGEQQFSFIYKIENLFEANYEKPFKVKLAFTMIETVRNVVELNCIYEVLRGNEMIGKIKLIQLFE